LVGGAGASYISRHPPPKYAPPLRHLPLQSLSLPTRQVCSSHHSRLCGHSATCSGASGQKYVNNSQFLPPYPIFLECPTIIFKFAAFINKNQNENIYEICRNLVRDFSNEQPKQPKSGKSMDFVSKKL
jgi:hypothetical protein